MANEQSRRIKVLRDTVARKIAAGEVIDRPASLLRELVDNALDAGSFSIEVTLVNGGIGSLWVRDDGQGMSKEDLELCTLPHATSKIETEEDLQTVRTLGFRGEALAAVAACTRLTILTSVDDSGGAWKLETGSGEELRVTRSSGRKGTWIKADDLFYSIPARRHFLKNPGSETLLCRKTLEEKALAHPGTEFKFFVDGELKFHLKPGNMLDRVCGVSNLNSSQVRSFSGVFDGFSLEGVAALPPHHRSDRKEIHIFVNRRKIQDYALVQAVISGYDEILPGGLFPVAWVFLEVDPKLTDFNIHPAKREVRFRDSPPLFQGISGTLKKLLADFKIQSSPAPMTYELPDFSADVFPSAVRENPQSVESASGFMEAYNEALKRAPLPPSQIGGQNLNFRYLGQVMNLFLIAEKDDCLYLVDQHAAHERILFEKLRSRGRDRQALLVPRKLNLEENEKTLIHQRLDELKALGVVVDTENGEFYLKEIPQMAAHLESAVAHFLEEKRAADFDLEKELYANIACRGAVMDGHVLDETTAKSLISQALELENARCPHGRPIWRIFSRKELYQIFERIPGLFS